jgi:hypothetical protein
MSDRHYLVVDCCGTEEHIALCSDCANIQTMADRIRKLEALNTELQEETDSWLKDKIRIEELMAQLEAVTTVLDEIESGVCLNANYYVTKKIRAAIGETDN